MGTSTTEEAITSGSVAMDQSTIGDLTTISFDTSTVGEYVSTRSPAAAESTLDKTSVMDNTIVFESSSPSVVENTSGQTTFTDSTSIIAQTDQTSTIAGTTSAVKVGSSTAGNTFSSESTGMTGTTVTSDIISETTSDVKTDGNFTTDYSVTSAKEVGSSTGPGVDFSTSTDGITDATPKETTASTTTPQTTTTTTTQRTTTTQVTTTTTHHVMTTKEQSTVPSITTDVTQDTTTPSGGESNTLAIAVGATVGVVALIVIIVIIVICMRRSSKRKGHRRPSLDEINDYRYDKSSTINHKATKLSNTLQKSSNEKTLYFDPESSPQSTISNSPDSGIINHGTSSGTLGINGDTTHDITDNNNESGYVDETDPIKMRNKSNASKLALESDFRHSIGLLDMGDEELSASKTYNKLYNPTSSFGYHETAKTTQADKPSSKTEEMNTISEQTDKVKEEGPEKEMTEENDPFLENHQPEIINNEKTTEL